MKTIKLLFAFLLVAALILFAAQNLTPVSLQFLIWRAELSLAIPVLGAYLVGGITARALLRFLNQRRKDRKQGRLERRAAQERAAQVRHEVVKERAEASAGKI